MGATAKLDVADMIHLDGSGERLRDNEVTGDRGRRWTVDGCRSAPEVSESRRRQLGVAQRVADRLVALIGLQRDLHRGQGDLRPLAGAEPGRGPTSWCRWGRHLARGDFSGDAASRDNARGADLLDGF